MIPSAIAKVTSSQPSKRQAGPSIRPNVPLFHYISLSVHVMASYNSGQVVVVDLNFDIIGLGIAILKLIAAVPDELQHRVGIDD